MPGISKEKMAQGGYTPDRVAPDPGRDWTAPTDAQTLRRRVLDVPDQSRYGHATDTPRLP